MSRLRRVVSSLAATAPAAAASPATLSPVETTVRAALPLRVGSTAAVRKLVGAADVAAFATLLGDSNEIHRVDYRGAPGALFGGRPVAHGMLSASLIGTVFGAQVPGAVYVAQSLRFRRPVFLGDTVEARVTVRAARARGDTHQLLTCDTVVVRVASGAAACEGAAAGEGAAGEGAAGEGAVGDVVVDGEATLLAPGALR